MKRIFWGWGAFLGALVCLLGMSGRVEAQSHRSGFYLFDFSSYELIEPQTNAEYFITAFPPHDFDISSKEKTSRHHPWSLNLIRSATQSLFLTSGYANFPGSNFNIPPTLRAYQNP